MAGCMTPARSPITSRRFGNWLPATLSIDLSRVGIMGHSGGGYASVRALLDHPDVFHAAVATSGNHDQMGYSFAWTEKYMGPVIPPRRRHHELWPRRERALRH